MMYKLVEDERGNYTGTDGRRYTLLEAVEFIDTPEGRNVNCVDLNSLQEAMGYFNVNLTKADESEGNGFTD